MATVDQINLRDTAVAVAAALSSSGDRLQWQFDEDETEKFGSQHAVLRLVGGDGEYLHLAGGRAVGNETRLRVSCGWPIDSQRQWWRPNDVRQITISLTKPADRIAADIQRRLVGWYLPAFTQQYEKMHQFENRRRQQLETARRLATILGAADRLKDSADFYPYRHGVRLVQVGLDGEVKIETAQSLPADVAEAVLRLLAEHMPASRY